MLCRGMMLALERAGHIALPAVKWKPPNPLAVRPKPQRFDIDALAQALVLGHGSRTHLPNDPALWDADVFYSRHTAGVNFLFGDGSVRTIAPSINGIVYENLLSRNDGNVVGDF